MSKEQQLGIRLLEIGRGQVIFQVTTQTIHAEIPIQVEPDNPDEMVSRLSVYALICPGSPKKSV